MGKIIVAITCWLIAVILFWVFFFKLTPLITNVIPAGDWQAFLKIAIYVVVGYLGGIGIPLTFIIIGIYTVCID